MAFRDRAGAFTPVNVFGGLGEGLGQALGGGFTKATKRPLFKALTDKFRTGNEERAKLATLATLGINQMPVEGDTQYPIFQQIYQAHKGIGDQRADRADAMWETNQEAALKYLTDEDAIKFGSGSRKGKETIDPAITNAARNNFVLAENAYREANVAFGEDPSAENNVKRTQAANNLALARAKLLEAGGDPTKAGQSGSQLETFAKAPGLMKEQDLKNKERVTKATKLLLDQTRPYVNNVKERVKPVARELNSLKGIRSQLDTLVKNFEKDHESPQAFARAIKLLGLAVEPGLQVTSSEVDLYSGENWMTKLLEIGPTIARAFTGFSDADRKKLEAGAKAAGKVNPQIFWEVLKQATDVVADKEQVLKDLYEADIMSGAYGAEADTEILAEADAIVSEDIKDRVVNSIQARMMGGAGNLALLTGEGTTRLGAFPLVEKTPEEEGGTPPPEAGFGTPKAGGEDLSLGGVVNSTIEEAAGNATATDAVVSGLTSGGKKVTAEELRAKMKAKRAGQ